MEFAAELVAETDSFGDLVRDADPATPIPTCPDWTLKQLFRHVARGNYWSAQIVEDRLTEPLDPRAVRNGKAPDDRDAADDWLRAGAAAVVDAVERVGPDTEVWTFLGPRPAAWWIRRRLHEQAVHRADAALALGAGFRLAPDVAADGLTEWLERVIDAAQAGQRRPIDAGKTLHLHATDGGEWTLHGQADRLTVSRDHHADATTVAGPATELFLAVVRRLPADDARLSVTGDAGVWHDWLDRTPF